MSISAANISLRQLAAFKEVIERGGFGAAAGPLNMTQSAVSYTPRQMAKSGVFYLMYFMMALVAFGGLMVTAQLKPIAASFGFDKGIFLWGLSALSLALMLDRLLNGFTRPFWGWVSDHIGRYNTMAIAFSLEGLAIIALTMLVHRPVWFVLFTGFTFFAWGEIFSLFPAAIGDIFGPTYATTNYGIQYTAKGLASPKIAEEFLVHANEETAHADLIAERIVQLGGEPDFAPTTLLERSHADYDASTDLQAMIRANLVAERVAIEAYSQMIRLIGDKDSTTRRILEGILAQEQEHADELSDWLTD